MDKLDALKKGIFWICKKDEANKNENYSNLDINSKINLRSEIAHYWNKYYSSGFQKHIKPIFQDFKDKETNEFIWQEYLFAVGL